MKQYAKEIQWLSHFKKVIHKYLVNVQLSLAVKVSCTVDHVHMIIQTTYWNKWSFEWEKIQLNSKIYYRIINALRIWWKFYNSIWYRPQIWSFKQQDKLGKQPFTTDVRTKIFHLFFIVKP